MMVSLDQKAVEDACRAYNASVERLKEAKSAEKSATSERIAAEVAHTNAYATLLKTVGANEKAGR